MDPLKSHMIQFLLFSPPTVQDLAQKINIHPIEKEFVEKNMGYVICDSIGNTSNCGFFVF